MQLRDPSLQPLPLAGQEHEAWLKVGGRSGATPKMQYLAQLQHHNLVQLVELLLLLKLRATDGSAGVSGAETGENYQCVHEGE